MSFNKRGDELVLDLLNSANSSDLDFDSIYFNTPSIQQGSPSGRNTGLQVNAVSKAGYTGNVTVQYNRVNLSSLAALGDPVITIPENGTMLDVITAFNNLYFLELILGVDISDNVNLDGVSTTPSVITLNALSTSYSFQGSIDVTVSHPYVDLALSGTVTHLLTNNDSQFVRPVTSTFMYYNNTNSRLIIAGINDVNNGRVAVTYQHGVSAFTPIAHNTPPILNGVFNMGVVGDAVYYTVNDATWKGGYGASTLGWNQVGLIPPGSQVAVYHANMIAMGSNVYLFSGSQQQGGVNVYSGQTPPFVFDTITNTWSTFASNSAFPSFVHNGIDPPTLVSDGSRYIYTVGGRAYVSPRNTVQTNLGLHRYDTQTNTWTSLGGIAGNTNVSLAGAFYWKGFIYVFGGLIAGNHHTNLYRYEIATNTWITVGQYTLLRRTRPVCTVINSGVYIYGGKLLDNTDSRELLFIT